MSEWDLLRDDLVLGQAVRRLSMDAQRRVARIIGDATPRLTKALATPWPDRPMAKATPDAKRGDTRVLVRPAPVARDPDADFRAIGQIMQRVPPTPRQTAGAVKNVLTKAIAAQRSGALTGEQVAALEVRANRALARAGAGRLA